MNLVNQKKFVYVPKEKRNNDKNTNKAFKYAKTLLKSEIERFDNKISHEYDKIIKQGCIYLPNFFCHTNDLTLFNTLSKELMDNTKFNIVKWSQHYKHESPDFSPTFNYIVKTMADHFNVTIYQTRLNYYANGLDWKPFHHDSHVNEENFTIGISFSIKKFRIFA